MSDSFPFRPQKMSGVSKQASKQENQILRSLLSCENPPKSSTSVLTQLLRLPYFRNNKKTARTCTRTAARSSPGLLSTVVLVPVLLARHRRSPRRAAFLLSQPTEFSSKKDCTASSAQGNLSLSAGLRRSRAHPSSQAAISWMAGGSSYNSQRLPCRPNTSRAKLSWERGRLCCRPERTWQTRVGGGWFTKTFCEARRSPARRPGAG